MAQSTRIKTPLKQHLHRFRLGALPLLSFVACVLLTLWLWQRQVTGGAVLGEVESKSAAVTAGTDGIISATENGVYWQRFDQVQVGQPIVRLDDSELQARLGTVKAQMNKLQADLQAAGIQFKLDQDSVQQTRFRDEARIRWEIERRRIEVFQQAATVSELKTELQGLEYDLKQIDTFNRRQPGIVLRSPVLERQHAANTIKARLEEERKVGKELVRQLKIVEAEAEAFGSTEQPEVTLVLEPFRADIKVQEAIMAELRAEMEKLVITAPISGMISEVFRLPSHHVVAGDEIVRIVQPSSQYVVSFVRESNRFPLREDMVVGLRVRGDPTAPEYISRVETVGPHVMPVPPHQLSDPNLQEWGNPIYIPLPPDLQRQNVKPGQLLQVILHTTKQDAS